MIAPRVLLGEMLVEAQIVSREQLEEVLVLQKKDGRRLGTLLVELELVTETQVTQILSQQLSVPWVSLYHIDFSRQLLDLVPRELAERHCLVPIFVRRVRGQGNTLYVAMDDPANAKAQEEVSTFAGLPVRAMIAPPADIRSAIRVYYGGEPAEEREPSPEPTAPKRVLTPPPKPQPSEPALTAVRAPEAVPVTEPAEPAEPVEPAPARLRRETPPPESGPAISAREIEMPRPKRGGTSKMITLTLLDGTQVNLPARAGKKKEETKSGDDVLTARDLVAALRAVSHGADASEILGQDVHWEAMFAALLNVLLRKHLIADWEFVEEYKKI
jgi:type IV pilus assembly protein PilB